MNINDRKNALISFYKEFKHDDIKAENIVNSVYEPNGYDVNNEEYLILTDGEADHVASDIIKGSLWAFNPEFIHDHSTVLQQSNDGLGAAHQIQKLHEDGNDVIEALIDDMGDFIADAIATDGRGHFISHYDGLEADYNGYFIYRMN